MGINQSCKIENTDNPGLKELGIVPGLIEDHATFMMARWNPMDYKVNNQFALKNAPLKVVPGGSENAVQMPKDPIHDHEYYAKKREYDLTYINYEYQNKIRDRW